MRTPSKDTPPSGFNDDGRSPDSRVDAVPGLPGSSLNQWRDWGRSPLTVAGAVAALGKPRTAFPFHPFNLGGLWEPSRIHCAGWEHRSMGRKKGGAGRTPPVHPPYTMRAYERGFRRLRRRPVSGPSQPPAFARGFVGPRCHGRVVRIPCRV